MNTEDRARSLSRALRRLARAPGPIAVRNARRAVFSALRNLRAAVDVDYPAPRREMRSHRRRRSVDAVGRDLIRDGWVSVPQASTLATLSSAGIKTRWADVAGRTLMAPGWAVTIAKCSPRELRRAARNPSERKAILMRIELSNA